MEVAREELEAETACELVPSPRPDPEEGDLRVRRVSTEEFWALVDEGRIKDVATLAAFGLLARHGQGKRAPRKMLQGRLATSAAERSLPAPVTTWRTKAMVGTGRYPVMLTADSKTPFRTSEHD